MNIQNIQKIFFAHKQLMSISKRLSRQDVNACNYGLTSRQEKMVKKLEDEAEEIANSLGLKAYHQGDPRGCSLYLITKKMDDSNYNNGVAITE